MMQAEKEEGKGAQCIVVGSCCGFGRGIASGWGEFVVEHHDSRVVVCPLRLVEVAGDRGGVASQPPKTPKTLRIRRGPLRLWPWPRGR